MSVGGVAVESGVDEVDPVDNVDFLEIGGYVAKE